MNRYTTNNRVTLSRAKAEALLENARVQSLRNPDVSEVLGSLFRSVRGFYERLRTPITDKLQFDPNDRRSLSKYSDFLDTVKQDLDVLHEETVRATDSMVRGYNFVQALNDNLRNRTERLASMAEDLSLISDSPTSDTFVAGDFFVNESRIDRFFTSGIQADVTPAGGALTLQRTGSVNVTDRNSTVVDVRVAAPYQYDPESWISGERQDDPNRPFRVYEGRYYAALGVMEPAGGVLRWARRHVSGSGNELLPGQADTTTPDGQAEYDEINDGREEVFPDTPTVEELQNVRRRMFDNDPATYWQIETTFNPFNLTASVLSVGPTEPGAVSLVAVESAPVDPSDDNGENSFLRSYQDLTPTQRELKYRELLSQVDGPRDFCVTITVDLGEPRVINWINLIPENFGEEAWLEIFDCDGAGQVGGIATSVEPDGPWLPIEGLGEYKHENTLNPEANQELTDAEVSATMSPSRYRYSGQGVWQFRPREARYIRIGLRQRTPVPSPYEVVRFKLVRDVTTTITKTRKRGIFG